MSSREAQLYPHLTMPKHPTEQPPTLIRHTPPAFKPRTPLLPLKSKAKNGNGNENENENENSLPSIQPAAVSSYKYTIHTQTHKKRTSYGNRTVKGLLFPASSLPYILLPPCAPTMHSTAGTTQKEGKGHGVGFAGW